MKKFKKIMAGVGLGLIMGASTLLGTGCSVNKEQQAALDSVLNNSQEMVTAFNKYLDSNNKQISKDDAVELITLANANFKFQNFNALQLSISRKGYEGCSDVPIESGVSLSSNDIFLRRQNGVSVYAQSVESNKFNITKSDFNNDIHYKYENNVFAEREFQSNDFTLPFDDLLVDMGIGEIEENDIMNMIFTEQGYEFQTLTEEVESSSKITILNTVSITTEGVITKIHSKRLIENTTTPTLVQTFDFLITFKYNEDVDFSLLDAKIAEIEDAHLNN